MGEALFELEQHLRYKQVKLTPEETKILLTCKSKAVREFTFGGLAAATVAWTASKKLNTFIRLNLSGGAAALCGLWSLSRSLNSCVNHILSQDGSRMQAELATIMVNKYQNDPSMMGLISKQFYSEKVFDDANSDQPTLRWRYRNYFSDNISHGRRTDYSDPQGDPDQASHGDHQSSSDSDSRNTQNDSHKIRFAPKQVPALKADDQEAYMRMVKESKNERLTILLEETNKLLVNLGAAVQRQKDFKHSEGTEEMKDSEGELTELEEDVDLIDSDCNDDSSDLLKGQRQYNSAIHSIEEQRGDSSSK